MGWLVGASAVTGTAAGATLYVDPTLGSDCAGSYEPTTRQCAGGVETAYATIAGAAAVAGPGDRVVLRAGSYAEQLEVVSSGTAAAPIVFQSQSGETATLAGIDAPAIFVAGQSHVVIEGLRVEDSLGWGRLEDASHVVVRSSAFVRATAQGTTGGFKLVRTTATELVGNQFEDGNDNVVVQESDRNLIRGNELRRGRHSLLSIRCGDFNVVQDNLFENPDQKAAEIYDCEGVSDAPYELDATKHNLFEGNRFAETLGSDMPHDYNGIQYAGQLGIVRRNLFYDDLGGGLGIQVYPDEALYNYAHRIFHNTFVDNRCFGLFASNDDDASRYYGTRVQSNLFYGNADCSGGGEQVAIGNATAVDFADNALATSDPGFVDGPGRDLHLVPTSSAIDAAPFLAHAVGAGQGAELPLDDVGYFSDGFGIEGLAGDRVQLEGDSTVGRVMAIDYDARVLSLDASLSWTDGQGVHLAYAGTAPDFGAFEYGLAEGGSGGTGSGGDGGAAGAAAAGGTGATGASGQGNAPGAGPGEDGGCGCRLGRPLPPAGVAGLAGCGAVVLGAARAGRRRARSR